MSLPISKPLAFFDLETTGLTIGNDRIIEISILKVMPDGKKESYSSRVNPGIPIPEIVTGITGIRDKDVKEAPSFEDIAGDISKFLGDSDLAGYNSNKFDVPFLVDEFYRVGVSFDMTGRKLIDVQNIFHKMEPRNLSAAYKFYCDKELVNAHSAEADTVATFEIFESQLKRYDELKDKDIDFLHKFTNLHNTVDLAGRLVYNDKNEVIVNFGKHKGKKVQDVFKNEPSYFNWIMNGDFARQTKDTFQSLWDEFEKSKLKDLQNKFNSR